VAVEVERGSCDRECLEVGGGMAVGRKLEVLKENCDVPLKSCFVLFLDAG